MFCIFKKINGQIEYVVWLVFNRVLYHFKKSHLDFSSIWFVITQSLKPQVSAIFFSGCFHQ